MLPATANTILFDIAYYMKVTLTSLESSSGPTSLESEA